MKLPSNTFAIFIALAAFAAFAETGLIAANFDWPQWRGPNRDDISKETGLLKDWPAEGPKRVWLYEKAGNGYSAPAIVNGELFTMGTREDSECLIVLDAASGKELWFSKIGGIMKEGHGDGPRGTPTVDGDRVYALSGMGDLVCASVADGKILWQTNMRTLGGGRPNWGYTESVLVDGDVVLCTPGGAKGTVAALDKMSGAVKWQSAEFTDAAHYSSIVPTRINNTSQYVQRTQNSVVGLAVTDGKLLWKAHFPKGRTAVIPTPIIRGNEVYVAAGYGAGCMMVKIGSGNEVSEVYDDANKGVMANHHGGVILVGDYLYGYSDNSGWVCQNFATGEKVWASRALGKGAVAYADGMLYCVDETNGTVVLAEASPKEWKEHGRFKLDPQSGIRAQQGRVWTHPVISNGKLYLRDQELIYCFDVKAK